MSREAIKRAVELSKKGLHEQALELLRPAVGDAGEKPFAVAAMAFVHHRKGHLAVAKYLYGQAVCLQPGNARWADLLAQCAEEHVRQIDEGKARRSSRWSKLIGLLVCLLGGLVISAALVEPIGGLIYDVVSFDPSDQFLAIVIAGGVVAAAGLVFLIVGTMRSRAYRRNVRAVTGEDYSDKRHVVCGTCELRYLKSAAECPYCGSPRKKLKTKPEAEREAEVQPEPETKAAAAPPPAVSEATRAAMLAAPMPSPVPPSPAPPPPAPRPAAGEPDTLVELSFAEPEEAAFVELTEVLEEDPPPRT